MTDYHLGIHRFLLRSYFKIKSTSAFSALNTQMRVWTVLRSFDKMAWMTRNCRKGVTNCRKTGAREIDRFLMCSPLVSILIKTCSSTRWGKISFHTWKLYDPFCKLWVVSTFFNWKLTPILDGPSWDPWLEPVGTVGIAVRWPWLRPPTKVRRWIEASIEIGKGKWWTILVWHFSQRISHGRDKLLRGWTHLRKNIGHLNALCTLMRGRKW